MMMFHDRQNAGIQLGKYLIKRSIKIDVVLGLPRGGVVTASAVADILKKPLDVMVVRKLGLPGHSEYAVGAIAEGGVEIYNDGILTMLGLDRRDLAGVLKEEKNRLNDYERQFHRQPRRLARKSILLVDDGIATGLTALAAIKTCRKMGARDVRIAAPVASTSAARDLKKAADDAYFLEVDPNFQAVAQYYKQFDQVTNEEVINLLSL